MVNIAPKSSTIEDLEEELSSRVKRMCEELQDLWKDFGERAQKQKTRILLNQFGTFIQNVLMEEKKFYKRLIDSIRISSSKVSRLCDELAIPPFQPEGVTLLDLESILNAKVVELENEKKHRMDRLGELTRQEHELCAVLLMNPYADVIPKGVPSWEKLAELQSQVTSLQVEKDMRFAKFRLLRQNMEQLKDDLEFSPRTPFIRKTFFAPESEILLSKENITKIAMLKEQMEVRCKENKKQADAMRQKLNALWQLLNTDPQQREHVLREHSGNRPSTIRALQIEVQRCEALAREIMEGVIKDKRAQLEELWRKCHANQQERNKFAAFQSGNYTEELLRLHELEIRKWQVYYMRWSKLFENLDNLKSQWKRIKEFEERHNNNPKRFANRGGALLQEEKARKKLNRELQEMENAIATMASENEQQEIRPLHIDGKSVPEILAKYREDYVREKGRICKQAKK